MKLDPLENKMIVQALREYGSYFTLPSLEGFSIDSDIISAGKLAERLERGDLIAENAVSQITGETRAELTERLRHSLAPRRALPALEMERSYGTASVLDWLNAVRKNLGDADFDLCDVDGRTTHLNAFSAYIKGEKPDGYYRRSVNGGYLTRLVRHFGLPKKAERFGYGRFDKY